jgi:plasmid stabilization system protein ParE
MTPLEGADRRLVVDYLARHFGPAQAPARGRNPFLN